ncbi:MAG: basic amino acid/polyamine antiporter, family [Alphaproteobacteria bacterium]|nr:basic amino acid/polyamine antiporter, family [Alphaproteobacteria bacterium]
MRGGDLTDLTQPDPVLASEHQLQRTLGPTGLIMLGIGEIIGAGIFVITGTAAADHAGPAVLISFVIAGFGCLFAGLCYAEYATLIPESGSSYTYAYATMGRFMAWFIGWNMVLEYLVSASTVAVGWSGYFISLLNNLGFGFPAAFANAPIAGPGFAELHFTGAIVNLPAIALVAGLSIVLVIGVRESSAFNGVMVLIKTGIVMLVILFGLPYVSGANLTPFIPPNDGEWGHFGASGILAASGLIYFAYIGFETVSVAAQEARNPRRDIPIGILGSLLICTVLYILMAIVLTGITDWRDLNVPNPVSFAIARIPALTWLVIPIDIGALVGLASVTFIALYGQSRVFYAMARDGFLPPLFSEVHARFRTPHRGTVATGLVAALLAALFPLDILADLVSIGTLLAFVVVCVGIMMLRVSAPHVRRQFRTPWVWFVAPAGVFSCGLMMFSLSNATWVRLVLWTILGLIIYFAYGQRHTAPWKWKVQ